MNNLKEIKKNLVDKTYNFCGNAFWRWKKVTKNNRYALNSINTSEDWKIFLKNGDINSDKTITNMVNDFLRDIKIENTTINNDLKMLFTKND